MKHDGDFQVPLDHIRAEGNIRSFAGNDVSMRELIASIRSVGVLEPVLLIPSAAKGYKYDMLAGFRRYTASCEAGLRTIPARILRNLTPAQIIEVRLSENLHRLDMNAMEVARALRDMMAAGGLNAEQVAERLGRTGPWAYTHVRLLELPRVVQELIEEGRLTASKGIALQPFLKTQSTEWIIRVARIGAAASHDGGFKVALAGAKLLEGRQTQGRGLDDGQCHCPCPCCGDKGPHAPALRR
jgi:ParB/RepB/Spo0J family partition protein